MRGCPLHRYTFKDYVDLEADSPVKHEFLDGEIVAMVGGTPDRAQKLEHYKQIPSLQAVVIVSHREARIELWTRADGGWSSVEVVPPALATIAAIGCTIDPAAVYAAAQEVPAAP